MVLLLDTPLHHRVRLSVLDKVKIHQTEMGEQGVGYFSKWARGRLEWERHRLGRLIEGGGESEVRVRVENEVATKHESASGLESKQHSALRLKHALSLIPGNAPSHGDRADAAAFDSLAHAGRLSARAALAAATRIAGTRAPRMCRSCGTAQQPRTGGTSAGFVNWPVIKR